MRIRVFPPMFIEPKGLDENGYIDVEEGMTLKKLMKKIKVPIPLAPLLLCSINYKKASLKEILQDGDVVTFINIVSGG